MKFYFNASENKDAIKAKKKLIKKFKKENHLSIKIDTVGTRLTYYDQSL